MKSPHVLNRPYYIPFISLLFLFVCGSIATAQAPDLTAGGVPNNSERFNIGPTGLRGWAYQDGNNKTPDSRQILVTEVSAGSPADGMMAVDDVILGADGTGAEPELFTDDARKTIGLAIGEAEARSPASLKLLRWREGVTTTVTLTLETLGAYGPNAPYGTGESVLCPKTAAIIDKALNVIMTGIESNDGWNFNALALLAANDPTHPDNAARQAKAAELVQSLILSPSEIDLYTSGYVSTASKVAWSWGHKLIVLAEYYLNTGDASVLEANYRDTHFWKKQIHVGVF